MASVAVESPARPGSTPRDGRGGGRGGGRGRSARGPLGPGYRSRRHRPGETAAGYAMTAPALLVFGVFMFLPLGMTAYYSLTRYSGFGDPAFIGLDNFREIAGDDLFWRSLLNTGVLVAAVMPLSLVGGLALALLLDRALPARGLLRGLVYVPVVISAAAAAIVARWMFNEQFGVVNRALGSLGLPQPDWQTGAVAAMASIVLVTVWTNLGFAMVVYLAALQGVPAETYEAAAMDGAGRARVLRSITLPSLAPTTFFLVVYFVITSFQVFDVVVVMTGGGPANATTLLVNYAFDQGFAQRRQGYAAALGVVLYVLVLALTIAQWRAGRRRDLA